MSRIGEALLRVRDTVGSSDAGAAIAAPTWVGALDVAASENAWTFEPPRADLATVSPTIASARDAAVPAGAVDPSPAPAVIRSAASISHERLVNPGVAERIITSGSLPFQAVEDYRRLAATLHEAQADRHIKVVMITSAIVGEGKSLTAANLSITLSESYRRRVLLIDADLRHPSLQEIFTVPAEVGLSDGLRRAGSSAFTTYDLSSTLTFLPAGRPDPDPMASLTSVRMRELIAEARGKFDWVIVDTPPVTLMPDAKLLASIADTVLLVVGAGAASLDVLRSAVKAIGRKKVLGAVFNRAEAEAEAGYYYQK